MPSALRASGDAPVAAFDVDRLNVEDGQLVVQGRWSGVRGMRFLRPTLVVDGRQILATLEHKPWAPAQEGPWTAAFPWTGDAGELDRAWLEVAPSVTVPLGRAAAPPRRPTPVIAPVPTREPVDEPARLPFSESEPEPVARPEPAAGPALEPALRAAEQRADDHARAARTAGADRDRALAMRDEAVRDREAALRTRDRMSRGHDEALAAVAEAERRRDAGVAAAQRQRDERVAAAARQRDEAIAVVDRAKAALAAERDAARSERDEARAQHEELRAQRDEILLAHRTLEQVLRSERAGRARDAGAAAAPRTQPHPRPAVAVAEDRDDDDERPIGVRAIPAARAVGATSLTPRATQRADLATFDRWALRVLATAAATCFVLLLLLLARVFV
jgi:hypothetical protein